MAPSTWLMAVVASLAVKTFALESPIAGYGVEELSWEVLMPTGSSVIINGTVQDVYAKISELDPGYGVELQETAATFAQQARQAQRIASRDDLEKRDHTICNIGGANALVSATNDGISYLRGVPGTPTNGPGPGNCGRVSCSWGSAIWWCNDNRYQYSLSSFNRIADGAQVVVNDCWHAIDQVNGQRFDNDNVNFIVRGDSC